LNDRDELQCLPMTDAELLAEWIAPFQSGNFAGLLHDSIRAGTVKVWAKCPPPKGSYIAKLLEEGRETVPNWEGLLHPNLIDQARAAAACDELSAHWFDRALKVDFASLLEVMDQLAGQTPPLWRDEKRWGALEVFGLIAGDHCLPLDSIDGQQRTVQSGNAWRAMIWRIERAAGTWLSLMEGDAPSAEKVFERLHASLWPNAVLPAYVEYEGQWQEAKPALFTGATFKPSAHGIDLAGGLDVLFHSGDVKRVFQGGGAAQELPFTDAERRAWITEQKRMSADAGHKLFKAHPQFDGTKQRAFRREWGEIRRTTRGAPRKS